MCEFDVVSQQVRRLVDRANTFGVDLDLSRCVAHETDAQTTGRTSGLLGKGLGGRRRSIGIAGNGPGYSIQQGCGVSHRSRERELTRKAAPSLPRSRSERTAAPAGFEPDDSAHRRGDSNRSAAVAAVGHRNDSRSDGRTRPSARTPGRVTEVPGVVHGTVGLGFSGREHREFAGRRSSQADEARGIDLLSEETVFARRPVGFFQEAHPRVIRLALLIAADVLHQERNTAKRTVG